MRKRFGLNHLEIQKLKKGEDIEKDGELQFNSKFCNPPDLERSYAYAADTSYSQKVIDAVENCTLLYHEATFEKRDDKIAKKTLHSTSENAARVAKEANVGSLLLGHFSNRYKDLSFLLNEAKEVFKNSELSQEGKTYSMNNCLICYLESFQIMSKSIIIADSSTIGKLGCVP